MNLVAPDASGPAAAVSFAVRSARFPSRADQWVRPYVGAPLKISE